MGLKPIISLLLPLLYCLATPSCAQVYEISESGALHVRDGSGAVQWHDPNSPRATDKPALYSQSRFPTSSPVVFAEALRNTAQKYALSPALLEALVWQESRWHSDARSPKGAIGLTQLMPATALAFGVDARDPLANLDAGAHYIRLLLNHFGGDINKALAAYNAGVRRVERTGGIPKIRETQNYVAAIMARLNSEASRP